MEFALNIFGSRAFQFLLELGLSFPKLLLAMHLPLLLCHLKPWSATSTCTTASFWWSRLIWVRKTCIPHFLLFDHLLNYNRELGMLVINLVGVCEASQLVFTSAVDLIVLSIFKDQVNVILKLDLSKPIKLRIRNHVV